MIFKIQDGDGAASKLKANMIKDDCTVIRSKLGLWSWSIAGSLLIWISWLLLNEGYNHDVYASITCNNIVFRSHQTLLLFFYSTYKFILLPTQKVLSFPDFEKKLKKQEKYKNKSTFKKDIQNRLQ